MRVHLGGTSGVFDYDVFGVVGIRYMMVLLLDLSAKDGTYGDRMAGLFGDDGGMIDSGLFSVMFGRSDRVPMSSVADVDAWADGYLERMSVLGWRGWWVEVDAQKVIGPEATWDVRRRTVDPDPSRTVVVWHVEDGDEGLDRMVERYPYLGLGYVEMSRLYGSRRAKDAIQDRMAYIRRSAVRQGVPMPRVHILGTGSPEVIRFAASLGAYSSDATSWIVSTKYGVGLIWDRDRFVQVPRRSQEFASIRDGLRERYPAMADWSIPKQDRAVNAWSFARFQDDLDRRYTWRPT